MKKYLFYTFFPLILWSCSEHKTKEFDTGILWKIETKNGNESYIFGTVHLYPKNEYTLSKKVISKLKGCTTLAIEWDITNEVEQQKFLNFQKPKILIHNYKVVTSAYEGELINMEKEFIKEAQKSNIKITGLETTDELLKTLTKVKNLQLNDSLFATQKTLLDYQQSIQLYKKEHIYQYKNTLTGQLGKNLTELIVNQRNKNWISTIENIIQKDKAFIAVGMGHLGGEKGLLNLLKQKGYIIKRIKI